MIKITELTDEQKQIFFDTFYDEAGDLLDASIDDETSAPWGALWEWEKGLMIDATRIAEEAKSFFYTCKTEIEENVEN